MERASTLSLAMRQEAERLHNEALLKPAAPWSATEAKAEYRDRRVQAAMDDYWAWDQTYIDPQMYPEGYAEPGELHHRIVDAISTPGIHWFYAFRKGGKSVTGKKALAWALLTGRHHIGGTLSHDLLTSRRLLRHVSQIIVDNPRIVHDFNVEVIRSNGEELSIRVRTTNGFHTFHLSAFSEDRSVRGYSEMFGRPSVFLCDDLENRRSPSGQKYVEQRRHVVTESVSSGTDDAVFLGFGNIFATGTFGHQLKIEKEEGILDDGWNVTIWPAWHKKHGSGWPERYPAQSEREMRAMLRMSNDDEWSGDGQQEPKRPDGIHFPRPDILWTDTIADDARGVVWTDPNLSKKSLGDSTGMISLLFSPNDWTFYVEAVRCRSFSDSNLLLDTVLQLYRSPRCFAVGFDGNVTQESTWENNIRLWCKIHQAPFPNVQFRRYNVDLLTKNASAAWKAGRIKFLSGIGQSEDGRRFIEQVVTFAGKKASGEDDAPDALICAFELLHELGMAWPQFEPDSSSDVTVISDINPY